MWVVFYMGHFGGPFYKGAVLFGDRKRDPTVEIYPCDHRRFLDQNAGFLVHINA